MQQQQQQQPLKSHDEERRAYRNALCDLTFNSKPIINNLTLYADQHIGNAPALVEAIEQHLLNVQPQLKIPVLYLLDSILKNVGRVYRTLVAKNLVSVVTNTYRALSDTKDKERVQKLVKTWREYPSGPLFSAASLSAIESLFSPSVPSAAARIPMPSSKTASPMMPIQPLPPAGLPPNSPASLAVQQQIQLVMQQQAAFAMVNPTDPRTGQTLQVLQQYECGSYHVGSDCWSSANTCYATTTHAYTTTTCNVPTTTTNYYHNQSKKKKRRYTFGNNHCHAVSITAYPLTREGIATTYPHAISILYEGLELQCKQCGLRYTKSRKGDELLAAHLDWHFRQNRRVKEKGKRTLMREWYVPESDWVQETEVDLNDAKSNSFRIKWIVMPAFFGEEEQQETDKQDKTEQPSNIPLEDTDPEILTCALCNEPLVKFFDEDSETWMIQNAVRHQGVLYHQSCLASSKGRDEKKRKLEGDVAAGDSSEKRFKMEVHVE